ncbi:hypothetical protein [Nitrospina gracilis]|uniref:hypothetical protein n=1 Tax=Nitrospina gracilis TaxID=35801 RepID=UPI001F22FB1F|nr:hypothetical protein [Nitrospina gracilis]MCF8721611.1 hypothetical protein [Nitrospina gracilis Nb-211]
MNHISYGQLKPDLVAMLEGLKFDYFLTFNFNRETGAGAGRRQLDRWHKKLDRKLFGRYFYKHKRENRTFFIAFQEIGGKTGQFHYHALVKLPEDRWEDFKLFAPMYWERLIPSGDLNLQLLKEVKDKQKAASYSVKDIWNEENLENFVISTEFSKRR